MNEPPPLLPSPLATVLARPDGQPPQPETVAQEVPVALVLNGVSQAVMLATPADLEDFALGIAVSEGWLRGPAELLDLEQASAAQGLTLELRVTQSAAARAAERRRTLSGRTGCGLCGIESLQQLPRPEPRVLPVIEPTAGVLTRAMAELHQGQVLNAQCGGLHAAAWCTPDGNVVLLREDVGRHNALDKLIGAVLRAGLDRGQGFVVLSSRASVELVHKTVVLGAGLLATASAPTALAVESARRHGLALWAFVREGRGTRYA
ncbi:MAG: formate dehydrogenase accessory sulfurtransferase FdhD [Rubrivivax sp.]|nr:formate dehydrogenase accessory sulfurtransferase FdhD [Rubrivivax sp.]